MKLAQYTSATLRRALTTENTSKFFAQCVPKDVLGNQDMFTQMCTNCNSACAFHQILSSSKKNSYCRYSTSPLRWGKWMEAQPTQYITKLATHKVLTLHENSSNCLARTSLQKKKHHSTRAGWCTSKRMFVRFYRNKVCLLKQYSFRISSAIS